RLEAGVGGPVAGGAGAPDLAPELEQPAATSATTKMPPRTVWTVPRLPMASLLRPPLRAAYWWARPQRRRRGGYAARRAPVPWNRRHRRRGRACARSLRIEVDAGQL